MHASLLFSTGEDSHPSPAMKRTNQPGKPSDIAHAKNCSECFTSNPPEPRSQTFHIRQSPPHHLCHYMFTISQCGLSLQPLYYHRYLVHAPFIITHSNMYLHTEHSVNDTTTTLNIHCCQYEDKAIHSSQNVYFEAMSVLTL